MSGIPQRIKRKRVVLALLSLGVVALSLCAYVCYHPGRTGTIVKTSTLADEKFLLVLFPVAGNTTCRRAVLASLSECRRASLEIYADGVAVAVPTSSFTTAPPEDYGVYIARLNREFDVWGTQTNGLEPH
jgi:hypothetical protein